MIQTITCLSDLHGYLPKIDPCDVLIIAGDVCPSGEASDQAAWLDRSFREWLDYVPAVHVLTTWGNHDFVGQTNRVPAGLKHTLLVDESVTIEDVKFHGSPWSLMYGRWAYMAPERDLEQYWEKIDDDVDVLFVHGPAVRVCDRVLRGDYVGSETLRQHVEHRVQPRLLVTGHIHEARGMRYPGYGDNLRNTVAVGASFCTEWMDPGNPIVTLRWDEIVDMTRQSYL